MKYKNKKIVMFGIRFDSQKEAARYLELKDLERKGKIRNLELQKKYILQEGFKYDGKKVLPITYKADFVYLKNDITYIEDVKGFSTQVFKNKWKMLQHQFKDDETVKLIIT